MSFTKYTLYILLLSLVITITVCAEEIPRRAAFGASIAPYSTEDSDAENSKPTSGILIRNVTENLTASAAGFEPGDIIVGFNGSKISSPSDLGRLWARVWAGDTVLFSVYRNNSTISLEAIAVQKPYEQSTDTVEVVYGHAPYLQGHLRTIVTKPRNGKGPYPALLLIQGYPCFSLDNLNPVHPYMRWSYMLAEKGYVVMRVEKPGAGDSTAGGPCYSADIMTETNGFLAGYDSLAKLEYVDAKNIFILGHSMGGVSGPIIASQRDAKGLITYGTTNRTWAEYLIELFRFQEPRLTNDHVTVSDKFPLLLKLVTEHYVYDKSPQEIVEEDPRLAEYLRESLGWDGDTGILGRHYSYWQSIDDLNMNRYWVNLGNTQVLSVYGEADIQALNSTAAEEIAEIVNQVNPGSATFYLLPESEHSFLKVGSMEKSIEIFKNGELGRYFATSFNTEFVDFVDNWMKSVIAKN